MVELYSSIQPIYLQKRKQRKKDNKPIIQMFAPLIN
jgi:hypothetical protein